MTQIEIIEKNTFAHRILCKVANDPALLLTTDYSVENIVRHADEYEGFGRCRNIIDKSTEEYERLDDYFRSIPASTPFEASMRMRNAQGSTLTAFYTPNDIATIIMTVTLEMYKTINNKEAKRVLDPSCGSGAFIRNLVTRKDLQIDCMEADLTTREVLNGRIAAYRSISTNDYRVGTRYESLGYNNRYDVIASNMPYGDFKVSDPDFARIGEVERWSCNKIHNYYFMKSMHLLADGGIMAFITTRGFLGSEKNKVFREEMLKHGRIISIVRLPDNMFKTVDVGSDLVVYQKTTKLFDKIVEWDGRFEIGAAEDVDICGISIANVEESQRKNQYGRKVWHYKYVGNDMAQDIANRLTSDLQMYQRKINNMNKPTKPTLPTKPSLPTKPAMPIAKKPISTKVSTSLPRKEGQVVGLPQGMFALLAGADTAQTLIAGCKVLRAIYGRLDDDNRPMFLGAYTSLVQTLSYNEGRETSIHNLLGKYHSVLEDDAFKFLASLERKDDDGRWGAADVFFKDVTVAAAKGDVSAAQALAASLNKYGRVDMSYLQVFSKMTRDELLNDLKGQLFFNPITGCYEEADRWLTGNVVAKLEEARKCIDLYRNGERLAADEAVAALAAARPERISFCDIYAPFGSRWIPTDIYVKFLEDTTSGYFTTYKIEYAAPTDTYICDLYFQKEEWKAAGHTEYDVVEWTLRGTVPAFIEEDSDGNKHPNEQKRAEAISATERVQDAWIDWVNKPKNEEVRKEIERIYNDAFNNEVRPKYDGSFQTFPNLHLENMGIKDLYASQKDAIWMIKRNGGGVCWHEVGTGKTLIMCIASYEMKRTGICNKPLIIGLKANVAQIAETYRKVFPDARLLFPTAKDFSKDGRANLFNQIKHNDWDCIIMSHDQFGMIPAAEQTEMRLMQEEIDSLDECLENIEDKKFYGRTVKSLQKRKENLEVKLKDMQHEIFKRKDKVMDFAEMGIDHIFVDESHNFKNLAFATRNNRVAGIGNPTGSKKAWKLLTAIRDIQYRKGRELCATFASGTIVSNSLTELYIIFKYLRPKALEKQHISSFDSWSTVFCEKKPDFEVNIVGQIKTKERFASFVNLPELSKFLSQITDYRTSVMCGIDAPKEVLHFENAAPTPNQDEMLEKLLTFVNSGHWSDVGIKRECPANLDKAKMLIATNLARQTSLDPRILDDCQTYGDELGCKVRRCAENIVKLYRKYDEYKGTQFVFNDISTLTDDRWNMQQELHDLLVHEYGIPEQEVQFINDATTDSKRLSLFDRMNRGEVRVLIGSTQKLGTGVNAQERAVAIHHLDIPWRPSDLEQRNGRAIRKGNTVKEWGGNEVQVFIYATERTLDAYKFNLLKSKQMFIEQLNNGTLGIRRIDDDVIGGEDDKSVSYAEFLSILSGNTDLLEKAKLDAKILAMTKERAAFYRERSNAAHKVEKYDENISTLSKWIAFAEHDIKCAADVTQDTLPVITLQGYQPKPDEANDPKAVGRQIGEMIDKFIPKDYTIIGTCGSLRMACYRNAPQGDQNVGDIFFYIVGDSGQYYKYTMNNGRPYRNNYEAAAAYAFVTLQQLPKQIEWNKREIDRMNAELPQLREFAAKEWGGAEKLQELKVKLDAVKLRINPPKEEKAA